MSPKEDDDLMEAAPPGQPLKVEVGDVEATTATIKWKARNRSIFNEPSVK